MITHYPIMSGRPPRERSRLVLESCCWRPPSLRLARVIPPTKLEAGQGIPQRRRSRAGIP